MIVSRPWRSHELDLLLGHEHDELSIRDLKGKECVRSTPPHRGWTHDALECVDYFSVSPDGWEAYLGNNGLVHPKCKLFQSDKKNGRHRLMTPIIAQRILIFGGQIERLTLLVKN